MSSTGDLQRAPPSSDEKVAGIVETSSLTDAQKPSGPVADNGNEIGQSPFFSPSEILCKQACADRAAHKDNGLQRGLKNRHLVMISFGGVVGASIWYGTGFAVAYSGPLGSLICFFIIGVDVFFVMQCLGEMSTLFPVQGAFIELAGRFVDPALAFSMGWNYWYLWVTNVASKGTMPS